MLFEALDAEQFCADRFFRVGGKIFATLGPGEVLGG